MKKLFAALFIGVAVLLVNVTFTTHAEAQSSQVKTSAPKLTSIQAKAALSNELFAEETAVVYGKNLDANTKVYLNIKGKKKYFETTYTQEGSLNVTTFPNGSLADGSYKLHAANENKVSNAITVKYKNPTIPTIQVLSPNEGEVLTMGSSIQINWASKGNIGQKVRLILDYETPNSGGGFLIATDLPDNGSYTWKVANNIYGSDEFIKDYGKYYRIRGCLLDSNGNIGACDYSDEYFEITTSSTPPINSCPLFTRDLTVGSTGADVVSLQTFLETKGYLIFAPGDTKGYFGATTQAALAKYQQSVGISPANGYFGPLTRAVIGAECTNPPVISTPLALEMRNIYADSTNENSVGEYAFEFDVANVSDKDIYIPLTASVGKTAGFSFLSVGNFEGSVATSVSTESETNGLSSVLIKAGFSERFTVVLYAKSTITGSFAFKLVEINYSTIQNGIDLNLALQDDSRFKSPYEFIQASINPTIPGIISSSDDVYATSTITTATSTEESKDKKLKNQVLTVISPNGGEHYAQGDKIMYKWIKGKISKNLEATLIDTDGEVVYKKKLPNGWGVNKKMITKKESKKIEAGEYFLSICDLSKTSTSTPVCDKSDKSFTIGATSTSATSTATTTADRINSKKVKTKEICQITKTRIIDGVETTNTKDVKCNSKEFRKTSKKNKKIIIIPVTEAVSTKTEDDTE